MISASNKKILKDKLSDEDAFATSLLAILLDEYGVGVFQWDPDTLWINIAEDFGAVLPEVNKDKIQALVTAYTTDLAFISVETFNHICNVLSGSEANFQRWDILSPEEALWGMYELALNLSLNREPGESAPEYSHEIRQYLGVILDQEGIFDPPDLLRIAEFNTPADLDNWADDPEFFNAAYDLQKTNQARLLEGLGHRLLELLDELNDLPLQFRNEEWGKFREAVASSAKKMVEEHSSAQAART